MPPVKRKKNVKKKRVEERENLAKEYGKFFFSFLLMYFPVSYLSFSAMLVYHTNNQLIIQRMELHKCTFVDSPCRRLQRMDSSWQMMAQVLWPTVFLGFFPMPEAVSALVDIN